MEARPSRPSIDRIVALTRLERARMLLARRHVTFTLRSL
jgi:hypothetical protein